jgi:two-component system chemotaxis response regulator CheY
MAAASRDQVCTVMIVDDTHFMRNILRKILEKGGHTVVAEASDGFEAVTKFIEMRPEVVFMDVIMPHKNGLVAAKDIVAVDGNAKVLMCSVVEHDALTEAAREAGAKGFVLKPFETDQVLKAVSRAMQDNCRI